MDLISTLASQFGTDADTAQGLAGGALSLIKDQVAEKIGDGEAAQLGAAVPELAEWGEKAQALAGEGGGGGMLGALGGMLGGGSGGLDLSAITGLVSGAGLDASSAVKLVPVVLDFLKSRLDSDLLNKVLDAVPGLSSLGDGDAGGMLGGVLGGMLGGN